MAITAASAISIAQVCLNDVNGTNYTSAALLPILQIAYRELQIKMQRAGLGTAEKRSTSITVPAGILVMADGGLLPNDCLYPMNLFERGSSSEIWQDMHKEDWEANDPQQNTLGVWAWREETVMLRGATADRLVLMEYIKSMQALTSTSSPITIVDSDLFLGIRCGAIAAVVIGENITRGKTLADDAEGAWEDLKATRVKNRQSLPVRRKVNRYRR